MATQNLNVSGPDMLLIDNSSSYFQNLGYTRTSNFQFKLKELDPVNVAKFGATTTFKMHKQDHLIGNVDLKLKLKLPEADTIGPVPQFFTNKVGFAMIDRIRFLVGSNLIQEIEGEWLDLENTLYNEPEKQYVDIIGDARKRPGLHNKPAPLTLNQKEGFDYTATAKETSLATAASTKHFGISDVDTDRGIYEFNNDEYFGTVTPLMPETTAANTVQGRVRVQPATGNGDTLAADKPDLLPAPPAMPAYTGNFQMLHANEHDGATGTFQDVDTTYKLSQQYCGNPATIDFTVPLGLFFSKHPSMYFPIAAISASQEVTIEIKLRDIHELLQHWHVLETGEAGSAYTNKNTSAQKAYMMTAVPQASTSASGYRALAVPTIETMQLWCHYIQLSTSEADALVAKPQHVRLIKQIQSVKNTEFTIPGPISNDQTFGTKTDCEIKLSFLHPCQTLWVVIRDPDDIDNFEYYNYLGKPDDKARVEKWDFIVNGQSRHATKTERDYTLQRLVPMHHGFGNRSYGSDEMQAPIVSVDFALNGQSHNPSGHVNLSNAATQQLKLDIRGIAGKTYRVDVYAVSLNWVNIQNGTAKVVFA